MAAVKVYGSLLREEVNQNSVLGASTLCAQHGLNGNNCRDLLAQLITNVSTKEGTERTSIYPSKYHSKIGILYLDTVGRGGRIALLSNPSFAHRS
jgi:hypothetical protein